VNKKLRHRRAAPRGLAFEPLESRLLLSADLAPGADALAAELSLVPAEHRALDATEPAPQISMRVAAHELVFVDGAIADRDRLLADFVRATGADRPVEVVVLDPSRDGIGQIGEALAARTGLTAVHVLSHGRDGAIDLGATTLDAAALGERADAIAAWADAFAADGDLLLFGCDVADGLRGEAFLGELARLTGADVAASNDATGAAELGGDWTLEFATGAIETAFAALPGTAWRHTLTSLAADWDTQALATVTETAPGSNVHVSTFNVGGGTVTVTVADPLDKLGAGPVVSASLTGGFTTEQSLELNADFYGPGESSTITIGFAGFAGTISNVRFLLFDIDTSDDTTGFVDEVVLTANGGALNPTAVTVGPNASAAAGFGAAAIEGANNYSYNAFDGTNRVTGRYSLDDPIVGDPNEEDNAPGDTSNGNAYVVFGQNGITSVSFSYQHPAGSGRTGSGQGIALHDIRFDVNDPPAIGGLGTLNYTENDPAAPIAPVATVTDADSADFASGALTAFFAANGTVADQLAIRNEGTGAGQIGVSGADVTFGGVTIGAFAGGANGTNLVVTLNPSATPAAVQALARNITFANTSEAPSVLARTVRFTVADGDGGSAFADATVNVAAANDAPVLAGANALAGIAEDPAANPGTAVSTLVAGQLTDVDAAPLAGIAVTAVDGANGTWQFSLDGSTWNPLGAPTVAAARLLRDSDLVRFVPAADWNGTATLSFRAWDRTSGVAGATADTSANGGTTAFSTAVATSGITVSAVADAVNDGVSANEDAAAAVNVLANDGFENAGAMLTGVTAAANGTVSFTAAGAVTYTPNADWHGSEVLTYTVTSGGVTETATLTVTILPVADAVNDAVTIDEDGATTLNVLANDGFEDLGRTLTAVSAPANGAVGFTAAGAVTYTPNAHWSGTETLTYTVTAGGMTETGTFTITVTPVADAPTLTVNAASGNEDTAIALSVATALVDTDGSETLAVTVSSIPVGATLADAGGNSFTATAGNTTATITGWNLAGLTVLPPLHSDVDFTLVVAVTATETANGATATTNANLAVTVAAAADSPTLTVFPAAGNEDTAIALSVATALVDTDGSETLTLSVASIPVGATLADGGGNTFTATAGNTTATTTGWNLAGLTILPPLHSDADFTLVVAATATEAASGATATTNANLAVTVAPVADAPTLTAFPAAGNEDTAIALSVATALVDTDGSETLALGVSSIPIGATLSDGTLSFTASLGNTSTAITGWNLAALTVLPPLHSDVDFTIVVTATATEGANGAIATTTANLAVTVGAVADAPTLTAFPAAGNEDTAIALSVATALVDTDGSETLSLTVSSIPVGATLSDGGGNTFTATAGNTTATITGWNLAALTVLPPLHSDVDFTLLVAATATEAANGAIATTTANLTVTVAAVADAPTLTAFPAAGNEDTAIALSVATALVDADGSETLSATVSALPVGATLSDGGGNTFTATAGNTTATITGWNLAGLTVLPPLHSDVDFTLVVAATATETANGATATTNANLAVTVAAVADSPTLTVFPAAGNEDTAIALSVATALVDTDGSETLAVTVSSIPVGATLSDGGGNTFTATAGNTTATITGWNLAALTVTPAANADADFTLTLAATGTEAANLATASSVAGLLVDVLPVNDAPTVAAPAALNVVEDVPSPLLGISFADVDAGGGPVTATFTVAGGTLSATAGGGVAVGGTATARTLTGALADVNAFLAGGGLAYTTVLDGNAPVALTASLNDLGNTGAGGPLASPNANVTLNVIPVNDAPVLGGITLDLDAGGRVVLTAANMSATDVDDPLPGLVFLIANLQHGRFELAGSPGVAVPSFTQAQVLAGQVTFVHTDALRPPSYLVFVTDGASTVGPGVVALTFRPLVEPGGASKAARDAGGLPSVSFASGKLDTSRADLSDPFAIRFNRQPVVAHDGGEPAVAEAETVTTAAGARQAVAAPGGIFEVRPRGFGHPEPGFGEMDRLPTAVQPLRLGLGPERPHEEPRGLDFALDSIRSIGLAMSVGAVWWAMRAAGLVSSLLAITPTWRHIDPMPVLGRDDEPAGGWDEPAGEETAREDASADEMFDGKARTPPSA